VWVGVVVILMARPSYTTTLSGCLERLLGAKILPDHALAFIALLSIGVRRWRWTIG
jgi:hypothetical protein